MKTPTLSPQQAADRAGVSRKAIMDAIKADKVRAWKSNESGRWEVVAASLQTWAEARTTRRAVTYDDTTSKEVAGGTDELVSLRAERDEAKIEARLAAKDVERLTVQLDREREALSREQDTVADLRRRLDKAEEQVRALTPLPKQDGILSRIKSAWTGKA